MRPSGIAAVAALVLVAPPLPVRAQQPPPFRAGVDLIVVEATIVDKDGVPVHGLGAAEFTVTIDGRPRRVVFVDDHGESAAPIQAPSPTAASDAAASRPAYARPEGRTVIFVVDRDSLAPGNEQVLLRSAGSVLDALGPPDAAGLVGIPVGGVDVTRDLARVRAALPMMTGTRPRHEIYRDRYMSWDEAIAFERRDDRVIDDVFKRECYRIPDDLGGLRNQCLPNLVVQAREMLAQGRGQVQTTTTVLRELAERLAQVRGTKHVVLISGGMPYGLDLQQWYETFVEKAAEAGIVLYAIHLDQPDSDVTNRRVLGSAFGGREMSAGLTFLTGMTGGAYFAGVGAADGVFDRIRTEIGSYYVLGLEGDGADRPNGRRALTVRVEKPGLTVKARRDVVAPAVPDDSLRALLEQPTDIGQLPLGVTAYSTRGTEAETLRVLLSIELGLTAARAPVEWGYAVLNDGNVVATARATVEPGAKAPWVEMTSAKLLPGRYRLRVAAMDVDGRVGAVDRPLAVGMRAAGALQLSDLVLGVAEGTRLLPREWIERGTPLSALVETLSADPAELERTRAALEIAPAGSDEPIRRVLMAARAGAASTLVLNVAEIDTAPLPEGRYTASVVALVDNQPVGKVSRAFEVRAATK